MGTSNFHNVNATNIFAVEIEEDYEYDDLKSNIVCELSNLKYNIEEKRAKDELKSFPAIVLGEKSDTLFCEDTEETTLEIKISSIIRSGYYAGVNLDWYFTYYENGNEVDDFDIDYIYEKEHEFSIENADSIKTTIDNWITSTKDNFIEELENIYKTYSTSL